MAREHRATREAVTVFDQSSFAKFLLQGPDAEAALTWICANDVARPVGGVVYTQMLNDRGGIECDLTVTRLDAERFYIVTGTGFATHDFDWIRRNIPQGLRAELVDVTSAFGVLTLMGPRARDVLQTLTSADLANETFPFATAQALPLCGTVVRALRLTYVGELGWELHVPSESLVTVYEALMAAGRDHGIRNAGYRAIESLRLEKGYRAWGSDIGPDHTPLEAGLGWAVKLGSDLDFKGRAALEAQKAQGLKKRFAGFTLDDPEVVLLGRETLYRDGARVGWLTSGGFGHSLGKPIGYGYVRAETPIDRGFLEGGDYALEVAGERLACRLHLGPLIDPGQSRVKG